ncbi:MAG: glycoprotein [Synechococcaceae cyanobacterium RL_1_2]|nr:glycoprotein [Synechococcaceae cyanobacterium RL_1_2]
MYICVCRGVTEKQLNEITKSDDCSMEQIMDQTGLGSDCGCCVDYAHELLGKKRCHHPSNHGLR